MANKYRTQKTYTQPGKLKKSEPTVLDYDLPNHPHVFSTALYHIYNGSVMCSWTGEVIGRIFKSGDNVQQSMVVNSRGKTFPYGASMDGYYLCGRYCRAIHPLPFSRETRKGKKGRKHRGK